MRWIIPPTDIEIQAKISEGLKISPITAQILINRGVRNIEDANRYFSNSLQNIHDPFLLPDIERAVARIVTAIEGNEKITIYGDYDVDGVTATALLLIFFKALGLEARYYIPNRLTEGYGLKMHALDEIKRDGTSLIITVDCGANNLEEVEYAKSLGMDMVVTDHHELSHAYPLDDHIIINPKRTDSKFPFRHLAGVGVAFNLLIALRKILRERGSFKGKEPNLKDMLDLVALGTVADIVPLLDENRLFVKYGIAEVLKSERIGINELKRVSGLGGAAIDTISIAFRLAPRINAAGRIGDQNLSVELLTTNDLKKAAEISETLNNLNSRRQSIENSILQETLKKIETDDSFESKSCIALTSQEWHPGVIGIVANKLSDRFRKPSILITKAGDEYRGSLRSIGKYNIMEALRHTSSHLNRFGGHSHAAGINIGKDSIEPFLESIEHHISQTLSQEEREPLLQIDAIVSAEDLSEALLLELSSLEPFGEGNTEPILMIRGANTARKRIVGNNHLKFNVRHINTSLDAIGFDLGGFIEIEDSPLDIAFTPQINEWNGLRSIQLKVKDMKRSS